MSEQSESPDVPVLRLTGQQLDSIDPPPEGDWFVDFDEYEEFVPKRMYDAALLADRDSGTIRPSRLDAHRLARALPGVPYATGTLLSIVAGAEDWTDEDDGKVVSRRDTALRIAQAIVDADAVLNE